MSNEIIYCFNKPEGNEDELIGQCIYKACPMFSEELDTCKLELLKGNKVTVNPFNPVSYTHLTLPTTPYV